MPETRESHSCVVADKKLIVIGGEGPTGPTNIIMMLGLEGADNQWERIQ